MQKWQRGKEYVFDFCLEEEKVEETELKVEREEVKKEASEDGESGKEKSTVEAESQPQTTPTVPSYHANWLKGASNPFKPSRNLLANARFIRKSIDIYIYTYTYVGLRRSFNNTEM